MPNNALKLNEDQWKLESMTGMGYASSSFEGLTIEVSIKSVNSKTLDVKIDSDSEFESLKIKGQEMIKNSIFRGRVEAKIKIKKSEQENIFDFKMAEKFLESAHDFAKKLDIKKKITLGDLLNCQQLWVDKGQVTESLSEKEVLLVFSKALETLLELRFQEGKLLTGALSESLLKCDELLTKTQSDIKTNLNAQLNKLKKRVKELFGEIPIDEARLYQECALLVEKSDYQEESDRLKAHIKHFSLLCCDSMPKGRKLDFLAQEMLREANTLLTKASSHSVITLAIELKAEIERLREQVQNIQ